jgi:uncharacterized membrane protein YjfL (UPF0719 family)
MTTPPLPLLAVTFEIDSLLAALVYAVIGSILFGLMWLIIAKVTPFSLRKEIEDDQNTALAIVIGSAIIGMAMIISAAIGG